MTVSLGDNSTTRLMIGSAALGGMAAGALWAKSSMKTNDRSCGSCCYSEKSTMTSAAASNAPAEVVTRPVEIKNVQRTFIGSVAHFIKSALLLPFTLVFSLIKAVAKIFSFLFSPLAKSS